MMTLGAIMTCSFIDSIQEIIKGKIFSDQDLKILFFDRPAHQVQNLITYHLNEGNILKYKRGLYTLSSSIRAGRVSKFEISNALYGPSYISFESALSHHGLIPEAVYEVTSACFLKNKKVFENDFGLFSFRHSPVKPFFLEVEKSNVFIAKPLRALFDLVYSNRKEYKSISDIELDLRIDLVELFELIKNYSDEDLIKLGDLYKKNLTRSLAKIIVGSR